MTNTISEKKPKNRSFISQLRAFFAKKIVRVCLVTLIIVTTIAVFIQYAYTHTAEMSALFHLSPTLLIVLTIGYLLSILANAWVLHSSLALLGKKAPLGDNFLLTGYSSIVNFFGPLQSGPGVRAVYLKARYGVRVRNFIAVSFIFYAFFGGFSLLILCVAAILQLQNFYIFLVCALLAGILVGSLFLVYRKYPDIFKKLHLDSSLNKSFWLIGLGALSLIASLCLVYFTELHHVDPQVSVWQTLIYTAAADLALFVSITPGAIGFREAFLVFSEKLHGISTSTILSASIIDRTFYVVFLAGLFVVILLVSRRAKLPFFGSSR